jgi:hypothetical protein
MSRTLAREIIKIAATLIGMEFPTKEALNRYLKKHPGSDRSKHTVKKVDKKRLQERPIKKTQKIQKKKPIKKVKPHKKAMPSKESIAKVKNIMSANGIKADSDEIKELAGFKKTLGQRVPEKDVGKYYVRNEAKLRKDFIANMSAKNYPSPKAFKAAQKRIQNMPKGDFVKILAAIHGEEDV